MERIKGQQREDQKLIKSNQKVFSLTFTPDSTLAHIICSIFKNQCLENYYPDPYSGFNDILIDTVRWEFMCVTEGKANTINHCHVLNTYSVS